MELHIINNKKQAIWIQEVAKTVGKTTFTIVRLRSTQTVLPPALNMVQIVVIGSRTPQPSATRTPTKSTLPKCTIQVRSTITMVHTRIRLCTELIIFLIMVLLMITTLVTRIWWVLTTCTIQHRILVRYHTILTIKVIQYHITTRPIACRITHLEVLLEWAAEAPLNTEVNTAN